MTAEGRSARVAHVALWCLDLERAAAYWLRFFGAVAGEPYASTRRPGFRSRFLHFGDGASLELMTGPWLAAGADVSPELPGWAHLAISLGSELAVDTLAERMAAEGFLVAPPRRTGDGFYEAVVRDPEGNLIEITA